MHKFVDYPVTLQRCLVYYLCQECQQQHF